MINLKSKFIKTFILPIADRAMKTSISNSIGQINLIRQYDRGKIEEWQKAISRINSSRLL